MQPQVPKETNWRSDLATLHLQTTGSLTRALEQSIVLYSEGIFSYFEGFTPLLAERCSRQDRTTKLLEVSVVTYESAWSTSALDLPQCVLKVVLLTLVKVFGLDCLDQTLFHGQLCPFTQFLVVLVEVIEVVITVVNIGSELETESVFPLVLSTKRNKCRVIANAIQVSLAVV